jgi:hypothetical protein
VSGHLNRASRFTLVLGMAIGVGFAVTMGAALVGHEVLVRLYGEEGIAAIEDTPPMFVAVLVAYVAGFLAGLVVLIAGWRRLLRRTAGWAARHVLPGDSCGLVWTVVIQTQTEVPDGHYWTIQIVDVMTNVCHQLGSASGTPGGKFRLVGPT